MDNAHDIDDEEAVASAREVLGNFSIWFSDFARAIELLELALPVLERLGHIQQSHALASIGYAYGWTGSFSKSYAAFERGVRVAKDGGHPTMEGLNYYWRACIRYFHGRWNEAIADFERADALLRKHHDAPMVIWNNIICGYALYMAGRQAEGVATTRQALNEAQAVPNFPVISIAYMFLAEPLCLEGEVDQARELARRSLACAESGDNFGQLMAYRVLAMAAARSQPPNWNAAVESIETSIRLAGERGARPDEAIGQFRYAEILADMGELERAKEQLDVARRAFDDMGMLWWPEQAEQLAAQLLKQ